MNTILLKNFSATLAQQFAETSLMFEQFFTNHQLIFEQGEDYTSSITLFGMFIYLDKYNETYLDQIAHRTHHLACVIPRSPDHVRPAIASQQRLRYQCLFIPFDYEYIYFILVDWLRTEGILLPRWNQQC